MQKNWQVLAKELASTRKNNLQELAQELAGIRKYLAGTSKSQNCVEGGLSQSYNTG